MEKLFTALNESSEQLAEELELSYVEAVAETGENLFHGDVLQDELSELAKKKLRKLYADIQLDTYESEEVRKAFQLCVLKGLKEGAHPNRQMTPDSVGIFTGYLVQRFMSNQPVFSLLDPAVGTGNLLTAVLNQLKDHKVESSGVDVDDLLIQLSYINANLQKHPVQFYNQDSLQNLFVDPADAVICDLPVGFYPNDEGASAYTLKADEGHSYAHHLFIEQSMNHTKPGGYLFFIIPNQLFSSKEAPKLNAFIKEKAYIQGLLQLPLSMFQGEQHAKSIFILQKKGEGAAPPKQAMLADLPKFSNFEGMQAMMKQINEWFEKSR
ncbi:class I SAM-dependent methyltransferase [Metabacillus sp. KIGAM252]|uniref:Class I SAM-dependent methyltransferase n=1 Tax=Metabacillus flavus TaxID=2823519 RepID=A0ABS5LH45_9BACI|nr:class I SAM-dependent methyltransferase [Metabacillus flavus]